MFQSISNDDCVKNRWHFRRIYYFYQTGDVSIKPSDHFYQTGDIKLCLPFDLTLEG